MHHGYAPMNRPDRVYFTLSVSRCLGEQQRLAFARILLIRPDWIFLDEATSALDEPRERALYELLHQELPAASIISVGHRSTLFALHDTELRLENHTYTYQEIPHES